MKRRTSSRGVAPRASSMGFMIAGGWGCRTKDSTGDLFLQELIQLRGIRLAACRLHDLTYEEAEQLVLARTVFGQLVRVPGHDLLDCTLNGRAVRDLPQTLVRDDRVGILALVPHGFENILG